MLYGKYFLFLISYLISLKSYLAFIISWEMYLSQFPSIYFHFKMMIIKSKFSYSLRVNITSPFPPSFSFHFAPGNLILHLFFSSQMKILLNSMRILPVYVGVFPSRNVTHSKWIPFQILNFGLQNPWWRPEVLIEDNLKLSSNSSSPQNGNWISFVFA